jgi:hypothetical protein
MGPVPESGVLEDGRHVVCRNVVFDEDHDQLARVPLEELAEDRERLGERRGA